MHVHPLWGQRVLKCGWFWPERGGAKAKCTSWTDSIIAGACAFLCNTLQRSRHVEYAMFAQSRRCSWTGGASGLAMLAGWHRLEGGGAGVARDQEWSRAHRDRGEHVAMATRAIQAQVAQRMRITRWLCTRGTGCTTAYACAAVSRAHGPHQSPRGVNSY